MLDVVTNKPMRVSTIGNAGPFLWVAESQLADVWRLFDQHGIRYWTDEEAISIDGAPATVMVDLGRDGDADRVQQILDAVP